MTTQAQRMTEVEMVLRGKAGSEHNDRPKSEDAAERRRKQNRANQRAFRRRKAMKASREALLAADTNAGFWVLKPIPDEQTATSQTLVGPALPTVMATGSATAGTVARTYTSTGTNTPPPWVIPPLLYYIVVENSNDSTGRGLRERLLHINEPATILRRLFPLSPDHRLLTLIQYNVLRAALTNLAILRVVREAVPTECGLDRLIDELWPDSDGLCAPASIPEPLQLTALQRANPDRPHWIDGVASAAMRDNLLRHLGTMDEDEFCDDLAGGLYDGFHDLEKRGLIVWGDPWRPEGWEVTEGFAAKWGFLLRGCTDLVEATNRWREQRGDDPLMIEV